MKLPVMTSFAGFNPSTNGQAVILAFNTDQGVLKIETPAALLKDVLIAAMQASVACEARGNTQPPMNQVDPAKGVLVPASDLHVLPVKGAHKRLAIRVGMVDLSVMIQTQGAADSLIQALKP